MIKKYEQEISIPENVEFELVGRACLWFAKTYPKNDEALWWKVPEAFKSVIDEAYRRGYANGAGIKEVCDTKPENFSKESR